jgi:hypothetical protein
MSWCWRRSEMASERSIGTASEHDRLRLQAAHPRIAEVVAIDAEAHVRMNIADHVGGRLWPLGQARLQRSYLV